MSLSSCLPEAEEEQEGEPEQEEEAEQPEEDGAGKVTKTPRMQSRQNKNVNSETEGAVIIIRCLSWDKCLSLLSEEESRDLVTALTLTYRLPLSPAFLLADTAGSAYQSSKSTKVRWLHASHQSHIRHHLWLALKPNANEICI